MSDIIYVGVVVCDGGSGSHDGGVMVDDGGLL